MLRHSFQTALGVFVLLGVLSTNEAFSSGVDTIKDNIQRYEELAHRYEEAARRIDGENGPQKDYPILDVREHQCGILGELLDFSKDVVESWTHPDPGLTAGDPRELRLFAISLRNYVKVARQVISEDDFAWRYKWNLNCYGRYNSHRLADIEEGKDYTIKLSEDGKTISFVGDISPGTYNSIAARLYRHKTIERVELSSFGGRLSEAFDLGRLFRKLRLTTVVTDNCNSACVLLFLGGVKRIVRAPYYELGFHRVSQRGEPVTDDDIAYREIKVYADEMIGEGDKIVELAKSGTGWEFHRPMRKTLCELRIATEVEGVCQADLQ